MTWLPIQLPLLHDRSKDLTTSLVTIGAWKRQDWESRNPPPPYFCNQWFFLKKKKKWNQTSPLLVQWCFFGKGGGEENWKLSNIPTSPLKTKEPLKSNKWRVPPVHPLSGSSLPTTRSPVPPVPPKSITKEHPAMYIPQTETYVQPRLLWQSRL